MILPITVFDSDFARILFSRNFAYAKFRDNKPSRKFPNLKYKPKGLAYFYQLDNPFPILGVLGGIVHIFQNFNIHSVSKKWRP